MFFRYGNKWFHSCVTNRAFFVSLGTVFSEAETINSGVPQVSILGPLLFLLYINDIPQALLNTHTYLYADDTSIFCQHKDVIEIENVLNKEFANVCYWFVDNQLLQFVIFNPWKVPRNWIVFSASPGLLYHLIRRDTRWLANEPFK